MMVNIFEINKLISSTYKMQNDENYSRIDYVSQKFEDVFFIEQTSLFEDVLDISLKLELIKKEGEFLKLSPEANNFFKLAKGILNPSEKQILFLEHLLIKSAFFYTEFKKYFSNFHIDWSDEIPIWRSIKKNFLKKTNSFELFIDMSIFDTDEDGLFIPIEKNHLVSFLINKKYFPKINYEYINKKKTEIGEIGEQLTLQYELKRLKDSKELAQRIIQISDFDDAAGYDIRSFQDATSDKHNWDKLIEVKSTTDSDPHFYFSMNEIKTASFYKSKYYIYLWTDILNEKPKLRILSNPFEEIFVQSKVRPEPISYFINQNLIEHLEQFKLVEL